MSGYLSGLSSPSATERDHHARVLPDPELGRADEVADVLDDQQVELVERQRGQRRADHVRVEVALAAEPASVLSWTTGTCSEASRSASRLPCTSPSSTPARTSPSSPQHPLEQRRLARAGRAHEVDHGHARAVEVAAVGRARSSCWRRARPRRPGPSRGAFAGLLDLDGSTSSSSPVSTATSADPQRGQRKSGRSISHSCAQSAQRSARRHDLLLEPRALAHASRARPARSRTRASRARPGAGARAGPARR